MSSGPTLEFRTPIADDKGLVTAPWQKRFVAILSCIVNSTVAITEQVLGKVRASVGVNTGTPRIILENSGVIWEIDNEQAVSQSLRFFRPGTEVARLTADSHMADGATALLIRRNVGGTFTLQQVTMGAADSGGTGFKVLRVPN